MPPAPRNERYICTLLDRFLLDESRGVTRSVQEEFSLQEYLVSIQRDLRDLLNTRQTLAEASVEGLEEVKRSVLMYGLPVEKSEGYITPRTPKELAQVIESVIRQFEPRLMHVKVTPPVPQAKGVVSDSSLVGVVRFKVEAMARMEPRPQRVEFDTTLDPDKQEYEIESHL